MTHNSVVRALTPGQTINENRRAVLSKVYRARPAIAGPTASRARGRDAFAITSPRTIVVVPVPLEDCTPHGNRYRPAVAGRDPRAECTRDDVPAIIARERSSRSRRSTADTVAEPVAGRTRPCVRDTTTTRTTHRRARAVCCSRLRSVRTFVRQYHILFNGTRAVRHETTLPRVVFILPPP